MSDTLEDLARAHAVLRGSLLPDEHQLARDARADALAGHRQIRAFVVRQLWHSLRKLGLRRGRESLAQLRTLAMAPAPSTDPVEAPRVEGVIADTVLTDPAFQAVRERLAAEPTPNPIVALAPLAATPRDLESAYAEAVHTNIGLLCESMLSIIHGTINARVGRRRDDPTVRELASQISAAAIERHADLTRQLRDTTSRWQAELDAILRRAYAHTLEPTASTPVTLLESIDELVDGLLAKATVHNAMDELMRSLLEAKKRSDAERVGSALTQLGLHLRETVGAAAGLARLAFDLQLGVESDAITRVARTPFDLPTLPNGKNLAIHRLDGCANGDFVEVSGIVRAPEALRTSKGALIWRATLHDPSSEAEVEIATLYTHLGHLGLDEGCFATINGHVAHSSNLLGDRPGVEIDRLELSALERQSWKLALFAAAKPYYQVFYNGTNARWSLARHSHDHAKAVIHQCGACELMFQPLWASEAYKADKRRKYAGNEEG